MVSSNKRLRRRVSSSQRTKKTIKSRRTMPPRSPHASAEEAVLVLPRPPRRPRSIVKTTRAPPVLTQTTMTPLLMTTEKADEVIDALDSQFEGRLLQMGWPMAPLDGIDSQFEGRLLQMGWPLAPLKTKRPLPTTRRVMRSAITGLTYGPPKGDGWTHDNPSAQIIETHAFITTLPPPVYCHVSPVPRRSMNASGSIVLSRLNQRLEYFSVSPKQRGYRRAAPRLVEQLSTGYGELEQPDPECPSPSREDRSQTEHGMG